MSPSAELERFREQHRACGPLTASATPPIGGGCLLTLSCSCGATLDDWVGVEEAKRELSAPAAPPLPASPPPSAPSPPRAAPASPEPPRAPTPPKPPARETPPAPSEKLDAALKLAMEAALREEAPPAPPAPAPPGEPVAARPAPKPVGGVPQAKLDAALKRAVEAEAAETARRPAPPAARPRRSRAVYALIVLCALLIVLVVWYGTGRREALQEPVSGPARPAAPARPRLSEAERKSVTEALVTVRDLQSLTRGDAPYNVYATRVQYMKADVGRYLQAADGDLEMKAAFRDILALYDLAASAWRARTLNEKDKWETVGRDPAIDLCQPLRRVADFADEPPGMSRAQWRGIAVGAAIPLAWECAATRANEIDRVLKER